MGFKYFFICFTCLFIFACSFFNETGKTYLSARGLIRDQDNKGFILLATFGDSWPAEVIGAKRSKHEIDFLVPESGRQVYSDYYGYDLKVLELRSKNGEKIFAVFRSKKK